MLGTLTPLPASSCTMYFPSPSPRPLCFDPIKHTNETCHWARVRAGESRFVWHIPCMQLYGGTFLEPRGGRGMSFAGGNHPHQRLNQLLGSVCVVCVRRMLTGGWWDDIVGYTGQSLPQSPVQSKGLTTKAQHEWARERGWERQTETVRKRVREKVRTE